MHTRAQPRRGSASWVSGRGGLASWVGGTDQRRGLGRWVLTVGELRDEGDECLMSERDESSDECTVEIEEKNEKNKVSFYYFNRELD